VQHAVSTLPRVRVMGHHQHGSAGVSIFPQGVQHGNGIIGIQIARGLVRQDQLGPVEQRSSQGDTLPIPSISRNITDQIATAITPR